MIDKLVIATKLTGKSCAEKNGKFVYWVGNDENSTEEISNDLLTAIDTEYARLQAEYDAKQYQRDRAAEYPSFADQFDMLYHGGYDAWKAQIDAIKTKYPKP